MRRLRSASGGFTLLELLVAIGIFAIFSSLAYASLLRMLDTRDRLDREREFWRELALATARLEDDLATARPRSVRDVYGNPLPALRGRPVDPRALGEPGPRQYNDAIRGKGTYAKVMRTIEKIPRKFGSQVM